MNLFDSIGLKSDPFSTSPNVDLFYPAAQHRQCLEGLELSVRLRRGLSVIRGGIGVGKTTVSRKLMEIFRDESDTYEFHLIHDPKFETELIFLKHIIDLFGIKKKGDDVQSCRNIVENYFELFFPIYSSEDFYVNKKSYSNKIRFILTLDPENLTSLFTRRWF